MQKLVGDINNSHILSVTDPRDIWQAVVLKTVVGGEAVHTHDCWERQYHQAVHGDSMSLDHQRLHSGWGQQCKEAEEEGKARARQYYLNRGKGDGCPH